MPRLRALTALGIAYVCFARNNPALYTLRATLRGSETLKAAVEQLMTRPITTE